MKRRYAVVVLGLETTEGLRGVCADTWVDGFYTFKSRKKAKAFMKKLRKNGEFNAEIWDLKKEVRHGD